jgi:hypothetical protein
VVTWETAFIIEEGSAQEFAVEFYGLGPVELIAIGATGAALVLVALVMAFRRLSGRKPIDPEAGLNESLADYPSAPPAGTHRLSFEGRPVRIRLVVLAAAGRAEELLPSMAEGLLESVLYGLGTVMRSDRPRVRVWPGQLSQTGFAPKFFRHVSRREADDEPSQWILVAGPARAGAKVILLGLALETAEPSTRGSVPLDVIRWPELFRVQVI